MIMCDGNDGYMISRRTYPVINSKISNTCKGSYSVGYNSMDTINYDQLKNQLQSGKSDQKIFK